MTLCVRDELFGMADIVTPNLKEASALLGGMQLQAVSDMALAAKSIHKFGPKYVLFQVSILFEFNFSAKYT